MTLVFYKCRWCDQIFDKLDPGFRSPSDTLKYILYELEPEVALAVHQCDDERCGVGDLIGARRATEADLTGKLIE